ncbi:hypothetical protein J437_LFUL002004 [Ladona fulva]|uniref:Saccharopine dehydrogenase (NAD(+), L-glutamate-forming) n=1 Tax=Ladona fulva TaxID=123851 RepID=A0A8K0NV44_LADFU|nr:hypothetical protein J437_LFUL002004 [Ladona fulva]
MGKAGAVLPFQRTKAHPRWHQGHRAAFEQEGLPDAGAIVQEDISEATVIFGVKQVPVDSLIPDKTYCFFSHVIKGQEANMPLLDAVLEKNIRLIDYEKLVDDSGQRVVAFGKYAGVAGMVNILHGLGLRLLALGHHTPFMHIGPAHNYRSSSMARQAIRDAGYEISLGMMPKSIGPLTFIFTGSGNVSQGAQEVFQELPHEYVPPEMLKKVAEHGANNKLYACEVSRTDHLEHKETGMYDPQDYEENPSSYISTFSKKIAPYASVIINGIYWAVSSPKLMTIPDAKYLLRPANTPWLPSSVGSPTLPHRMLAICDISADPGGSIEFMNECTTIDTPFCLYDADRNKDTKSKLKAIIASNGRLTPNFEYIHELRLANRNSQLAMMDRQSASKKVLVLGAGFVSAPVVEYLTRDKNIALTVASALKDEADAVATRFPGVEPVLVDVIGRPDHAEEMVKETDLVISLLPYPLHPSIATACVAYSKNMVTASYCSAEMQELHQRAVDAGITVVNEVGLDPGVDHLLALECLDEIHQGGGKVESFVSYCGGLPAPEFSDNPLRYKFSWSPRGVLLNTLGAAKYKKNGEFVIVEEGGSLMDSAEPLDFLPGFSLEGFPNRDSTKYADLYKIPEAKTILREIFMRHFICMLLGEGDSNIFYENLKQKVYERVGRKKSRAVALEQLGLLEDDPLLKLSTPLDTVSHFLSKKLVLGEYVLKFIPYREKYP